MDQAIALYYLVKEEVGFEEATQEIMQLLFESNKQSQFQDRILYIDIEGHINCEGKYDHDMQELQRDFITNFLLDFFTEIHTPLTFYKNSKPQRNDIPDELRILKS